MGKIRQRGEPSVDGKALIRILDFLTPIPEYVAPNHAFSLGWSFFFFFFVDAASQVVKCEESH